MRGPEVFTVPPGGDTAEPQPSGVHIVAAPTTPPPAPPDPSTCGAIASLRPRPAGTPLPAAAGSSLQRILARQRLIVGVDQSTNLFSFRDPITSTLQGFSVDIAREVAADLFGDPSKLEFQLLTYGDFIGAVEQAKSTW
jgi:polar amino acid transport system substrate-binding protein